MWLSERKKGRGYGAAMVGQATLSGDPAGAYLDAERRALAVFAPGGYVWRPAVGEEVLVLKQEGEHACVVGARCGGELNPGEVLIRAGQGNAAIKLGNDGTVSLVGQVLVNGVPLEDMLNRGGGA
ncbi:hypothetical protein [Pseudoflavonifractor capillosus]|uniref:Uncharacterized protein n=1 Tax=Pseudoflavonifractor capillosus TaxID=106588 RepID=A0A921MND2_9FIRM|nr:hypothetical protein [Pseudoflavonifractor capillosus]HJG87004.1 hypothetical protein [Pseudoflavonifractor capillosus]